jgi:hypothetical protein
MRLARQHPKYWFQPWEKRRVLTDLINFANANTNSEANNIPKLIFRGLVKEKC